MRIQLPFTLPSTSGSPERQSPLARVPADGYLSAPYHFLIVLADFTY